MEETKKNDVQKKNWFAGLKSEFQKIVWLDKKSLGKQTVAVLVVSVILGAIIAVLDLGIQYGIDFLVNLYEDHLSKEAAEQACRKIFKTKSGKRICQQMFGLSL